MGAAFALENAKELGARGERSDRIGLLAAMDGPGEEGDAAVGHLEGEIDKGAPEGVGDGIGEVDQDGVEQPGDPELELDAVGRVDPEVSQPEQPLDAREGLLDSPPAGVEGHDLVSRETLGVELVGQVAVPEPAARDGDQADDLAFGPAANGDQRLLDGRGATERADDLTGEIDCAWRAGRK
jgi:hypothetical protein